MQQPPSQGGGTGSGIRSETQSTGTSSTPSQSTTGAAASELRDDAKQLGSTAANRLHSEVDARKGTAADQAKSVSSALERTAGELDEGAPEWLKSAFRQGAQQIQRFADTIEQKDSRQILGEVQSFARERPGTFLAACAAAGFAAARILKAGSEQQSTSPSYPAEAGVGDEPAFSGSQSNPSFASTSRGEFV